MSKVTEALNFDLQETALDEGTMQLEASAGTGKTYTITGIVLRLLLERKVSKLSEILVVTFTIAATEELKDRLREGLRQAMRACLGEANVEDGFLQQLGEQHGSDGAKILRDALRSADEMSVSTIDAFCKRILDEAAFEAGVPFETDFLEGDLPLLATAARDSFRLEVVSQGRMPAAIALRGKLSPEKLLGDFRDYSRHPECSLWPEPEPLQPLLDQLRAVCDQAKAAWQPGVFDELFGALQFKANQKSPVLTVGQQQFASELTRRFADPEDPCLDWLAALAPSQLRPQLLKKDKTELDQPFFEACEQLPGLLDAATHSLRATMLERMAARLEREKLRTNTMTFQDLQLSVQAALHDPDKRQALLRVVRNRWQAALIDEFQDTNPVQYEILKTCFSDRRLILVGDPKQSIYGFRGADLHAYLRARADAQTRHTLNSNYRSHPDLIASVGQLFRRPDPFLLPGIDMPVVQAAKSVAERSIDDATCSSLAFRWLPGPGPDGSKTHTRTQAENYIVEDIANECVRLLTDRPLLGMGEDEPPRPLRAQDIAILTRTNYQAYAVQQALRERSVHSAIRKAGDVFTSPEIQDLEQLLVALSSSGYQPDLHALWCSDLWGMSPHDLLALETDQDRLAQQLEETDGLRETWRQHGFIVMFQSLLHQTAAHARLLERTDGERKLTNYLQIAELLHQAETSQHLAPESLLRWLQRERRSAQDFRSEMRELRLESDSDAVQILTIHGSKGLQYQVVFVPFAWQPGKLPTTNQPIVVQTDDGTVLDCSGEDNDNRRIAEQENCAEDLRLFYVALTRACRRCYVHWTAAKGDSTTALGYLLSPPAPPEEDSDDAARATPTIDSTRWQEHWQTELQSFCDASSGTASLTELSTQDLEGNKPQLQGQSDRQIAQPRRFPTNFRQPYRITSFSKLVSHHEAAEAPRDTDAPEALATAPEAPPSGIFAFARGTGPGTCLHEIFEHLGDTDPSSEGCRNLIRSRLRRHGLLEPGAHPHAIDPVGVVQEMVIATINNQLGELPFRLRDTNHETQVHEWAFYLSAGQLRPSGLAGGFEQHAERWPNYAKRLARLSREQMHGFLTGFVDLVLEHEGQYWVFDWKSNHLGNRLGDYTPEKLAADIEKNDYVLQYHLYLLALHRHLRSRLPDYDYDSHIGGACYVYLRGIAATDHSTTGVFCDRPSRALIEALDQWLTGGQP